MIKCLILIFNLLFSINVYSQNKFNDLAFIIENKQINVGFRSSSMPISYTINQKPMGFAVDLCIDIINHIDKNININWVEIDESQKRFELIKSNNIDIECGNTSVTSDREKDFSFSKPFYVAGIKFLSKKDLDIQNIAQLDGKKVVVTKNTTSHLLLQNLVKQFNFKLIVASTHLIAYKILSQNKADTWLMDDVVLAAYKNMLKDKNNWTISQEPTLIEPYAILIYKNNNDLLNSINKNLVEIYKEGKWDFLYKKWFQKDIVDVYNNKINLNLPKQNHIQKLLNIN